MGNQELNSLLTQLMQIVGARTGEAIRSEINALANIHGVDIQELQNKIKVLQDILDADPSTPEFDQAQNIITRLNDLLARMADAEAAVTKLNGDESVVGSVDYKIAQEKARAKAAEQANAQCCQKNTTDVSALKTRMDDAEQNITNVETAVSTMQSNIVDIQTKMGGTVDALSDTVDELSQFNGNLKSALGVIDENGNFVPQSPDSDTDNLYEYIHDVAEEGDDRANTLKKQIKRLAKKSRNADKALASRLDTLEGDENTDGSVAKAVKTEADRAIAAEQSLQSQIDSLSGGGSGSIQGVRDEVAAVRTGAGLESDGSYAADASTSYIKDATSLKDADKKLDAAVKGLADTKADKSEVLLKSDIANIDPAAIGQAFLDALNCALSGNTGCDGTSQSSEDGGDGDGAVI